MSNTITKEYLKDYYQRVTWCAFLCGIGIGVAVAALIIGGLWL